MDAAVIAAVASGVLGLSVAVVTGLLNLRKVRQEKTLPSYEVLAGRVSHFDSDLRRAEEREREARDRTERMEVRLEKLEDCYDKMESILEAQQEWIKQAVALAEITGAIAQLAEPPAWIDLDTPSMRQRRTEMRKRYDP